MDEHTDKARPDARIAALAARQHGVVSWCQLIDAGIGRGAIDHRVRIGWLHRMHRGVFAVGHRPLTREARWMGAVLACGDRTGLSHMSATALWEIRPYWGTWIDVTVPTTAGRTRRERIRVHRSSTLSADDVTTHRGIPVTTIARTLLDVAARFAAPALARTVNHLVEGEEVDFCWPEHRLVIETDGRQTHLTLGAFERDRAKDADLVAAGLRVVRLTHRRLREDPAGVAALLQRLLRAGPTRASR